MAACSSFDYICVIDFEATCIDNNNKKKQFYPHEIIEFPCVIIDTETYERHDSFHAYVKPLLHPELSDFCKNLTGICQDDVNEAETFRVVLRHFGEFIKRSIPIEKSFIILTDGSWDINKFLALQCMLSDVDFPYWAKQYIDLKRTYEYYHKKSMQKLETMLQTYGLIFQGRLHSGKDDTDNIAELVITMMKNGCTFISNASVTKDGLKLLRNSLTTYFRQKHKEKLQNKKPKEKKQDLNNQTNADSCIENEMEIDPELLGCEQFLFKCKKSSM